MPRAKLMEELAVRLSAITLCSPAMRIVQCTTGGGSATLAYTIVEQVR
jgi:hypothetical protein